MTRVTMVTPYPPGRDGIAAYAVQEVQQLLAEGNEVRVVSPLPSAAHEHVGLGSAVGWARLATRLTGRGRVIIQIYPELVYGRCRTSPERVAAWLAVARLARLVPTELRIHEIEYALIESHPMERRAVAAAVRAANQVSVHTAPEQDQLARSLGVESSAITLVDHGRHFVKHCLVGQADARAELGIAAACHVFLSVGFLQPHKGFDRTFRAFAALGQVDAQAHVVGSIRVEHPDLRRYADFLGSLADATEGAFLHERFVSDIEFDLWLVAADTVVLPYREIWSSGVIERAKLYETPVIAARTGGLEFQTAADTVLVEDDTELIGAMAARLGIAPPAAAASEPKSQSQLQTQLEALSGVEGDRVAPNSAAAAIGAMGQPMLPVDPSSPRRGVGRLKRFVQSFTNWQVQPVLDRVNELQMATEEAIRRLEADRE